MSRRHPSRVVESQTRAAERRAVRTGGHCARWPRCRGRLHLDPWLRLPLVCAAMQFGIFFELSVPRPFAGDAERRVYEHALEQARVADELGFDAVWAVEHHFLEEYSHCSA